MSLLLLLKSLLLLLHTKTLYLVAEGTKRKPKEGQPKKKGRRIKIKLRLKQSTISEEDDSYTDQVGWTVTHDEMDEFIEEPVNKEPEIVDHQCSTCGSMMRIPRPKRDRYTVICAYPECGHEDTIGM